MSSENESQRWYKWFRSRCSSVSAESDPNDSGNTCRRLSSDIADDQGLVEHTRSVANF